MTTKSTGDTPPPARPILRNMYVAYYIKGKVYYWNANMSGQKFNSSGPADDFIGMLTTYSKTAKIRLEKVGD